MACSDTTIVLAQDITLDSLVNGAPQIHWLPQNTWTLAQGAKALRLSGVLLQNNDESNTTVSFAMQYSYDGRTWFDSSLPLDGRSIGNELAVPGSFDNLYVGQASRELAAPFMRFGIIVSNGDDEMGSMRLSATVVALRCSVPSATLTVDEEVVLEPSKTDEQLGEIFGVELFATLEVNGKFNSTPTAGVTFSVQTSSRCGPDAMWVTMATSSSITTNAAFIMRVAELSTYARVVYTSTMVGSATLVLDVSMRAAS